MDTTPHNSQAPYAIIACDVFRDELEAIGGENPSCLAVRYLEMELHDRPDTLRKQIQNTIAEFETTYSTLEAIVLVYGLCGNGLLGVRTHRCALVLPQAHDCISVFMGGAQAHCDFLKQHPATYFYSPGWIRKKRVPGPDRENYLRKLYGERYPDDPEMIEELIEIDAEAFAHHNTAAYISLLENPEAKRYCQSCAKTMNWQFREVASDASLLKALLLGNWQHEQVLTIPANHQIALCHKTSNLIAKSIE